MASPLNFKVYDNNHYSDAGNSVDCYRQLSLAPGGELPVTLELEQPSVDDRFHATFPLSHL